MPYFGFSLAIGAIDKLGCRSGVLAVQYCQGFIGKLLVHANHNTINLVLLMTFFGSLR